MVESDATASLSGATHGGAPHRPAASPREAAQQRLVDHLNEHHRMWTAPYGVLDGLHAPRSGKGKVRTVTWGVARSLDATAWIWSPTHIVVDGQGGLAYRVAGTYSSMDQLIAALEALEGECGK